MVAYVQWPIGLLNLARRPTFCEHVLFKGGWARHTRDALSGGREFLLLMPESRVEVDALRVVSVERASDLVFDPERRRAHRISE
jgi:hypothetical protein